MGLRGPRGRLARQRAGAALGRGDVFSRAEMEALAQRLFGLLSNTKAQVTIASSVSASTYFARGDVHLSTESASASVSLSLLGHERRATVTTTRYDDAGLRALAAEAEAAAREWRGTPRAPELLGPQGYQTPPRTYFEANLPLMTPEGRAALYMAALDATEAAGLIGAGDIALNRSSRAVINTEGLFGYSTGTYGEFSLTARTKDGTGSGWAWRGYEDWARVDTKTVIATAVDLAQRSAKPVAVEPGRYTVILEPAAVAALLPIDWDAWRADQGYTVFSKDPLGTNKIGLQMLDTRLEMVSDPWDSEAPQTTVGPNGQPLDTVQWFTKGVLRELYYHRWYAREKGRAPTPTPPGTLRLYSTGQPTSLEEMIASTKRGVWVNRLSNVIFMNGRTLLLSGTTRDGTFLIENGKITKPIKNFRFTDSPFFVLNRLEAWGEPVRASGSIVAPRLKVRDFDFTSLSDTI